MSANNPKCSGCLSMSKMNENLMHMKELVHERRVVTFTDEVRILFGSC